MFAIWPDCVLSCPFLPPFPPSEGWNDLEKVLQILKAFCGFGALPPA